MPNKRSSTTSASSSNDQAIDRSQWYQQSRPLCYLCNIELDLHHTLGEPGSTELVCPSIVQAAALPSHHGAYTDSTSSYDYSAMSSSYQDYQTTRTAASGSRSSGTLSRRSRVASDKKKHTSTRHSRDGRSSSSHKAASSSTRYTGTEFGNQYISEDMCSPTGGETADSDTLRYSQVLSVQSFLFEESQQPHGY